jgi:hypothetical protein
MRIQYLCGEAEMSSVSGHECWKHFHQIRDLRRGFLFVLVAIMALGAGSPAGAQAINVRHNVAAIHQGEGNLCWVAATAMLLNWKVPGLHTMKTVATQGGSEFVTLYNNAINHASPSEISLDQEKRLYAKLNLIILHGILITGLVGDGTAGGTDIFYNDPATGTQVKKKVADFVVLYDGAANWTNNIIHAP